MSKVSVTRGKLGRQSQLPLSRAFEISFKSLRMRFGRSIITAGGIFLGIAFLTTVLTQRLMQWPLPEKIDPGLVRITGQIEGPGDYEVWKPIPVRLALDAGVPEGVVAKIAHSKGTISLTTIVQGRFQAARAEKNLARVKRELAALKKVKPAFYTDTNADKDISVGDAVKAGVPEGVATHLAGEAQTFKGTALADEIKKTQDYWVNLWTVRARRNAIFKTVHKAVIAKLGARYEKDLDGLMKEAKNTAKDADTSNVMIVTANGDRVKANLARDTRAAGAIELADGDLVTIPDSNTRHRMDWLVVMSLLVCTVGITNSMLMSVTERFKEIGTMKCLGALDKFVVTLFLLESGMMGIVASVVGWLVGFLVIILIAGFTRSWELVGAIGFVSAVKIFVESTVIGMALTTIATIAPALRAAEMPPAMALRSEI